MVSSRSDVERLRPAVARAIHRFTGFCRRREARVGLHPGVMVVVLHHPVDLVADIAAAGVRGEHEIGVVVELIELGRDKIDIEFHNGFRWYGVNG